MNKFNEKLKELREEKSLSQKQLANALKVSQASVAKWETKDRFPDIDNLIMVAKFFGVTVDYILGLED